MNPERKVEIKLWDWLITKSSYTKKIYFNSVNEIGVETFNVIGNQKKPDFILKISNEYGDKYCAVEIKDNSSSLNVLRADKIVDIYYKNYVEKKTEYIINNNKINIDFFVIATQDSINGYLFKNETLIDNWDDKETSSKYIVSKKYKIIPRMEGNRTFEYIRSLWNFFGKYRNNYDKKAGVGILIANTEDNMKPYLMITNYNKNKWGQKWWKI